MEQLSFILADATAGIGPDYFLLPIDGGLPAHRERVYCYELYHQIRLRWPQGCDYDLNGELDKRGHPHISTRPGLRAVAPDLLVHVPGTMNRNYSIIEVKPFTARRRGIAKDFNTLTTFVREWRYHRAIFLIYGGTSQGCLLKARRALSDVAEIAPVEVWHHPGAHTSAVPLETIGVARASPRRFQLARR